MGATLSNAERAAIAAYAKPVTKCPEGAARNYEMLRHMLDGFTREFSPMGSRLSLVPKEPDLIEVIGLERPVAWSRPKEELHTQVLILWETGQYSQKEIALKLGLKPAHIATIIWRARQSEAA